jgi:kynurenine formamidase
MPLENFFTEAVCLDLSHKALNTDASIADLEAAETAAGIEIRPKGTVLLHGFLSPHARHRCLHHGLSRADQKLSHMARRARITMFGVEAISPGRPGRNNFEVHHVCRDMGFTDMEDLVNLDKPVGQGRFRFIGFPLKIKGGSGSPIRAVAWIE